MCFYSHLKVKNKPRYPIIYTLFIFIPAHLTIYIKQQRPKCQPFSKTIFIVTITLVMGLKLLWEFLVPSGDELVNNVDLS